MVTTYSTYEAKARFSEVLRRVRMGQRIRITFNGREVAEIGPIPESEPSLERRFEELEEGGRLQRHRHIVGTFEPLVAIPGALERFLDERE